VSARSQPAELKGALLKTARAWALKESLRELRDCCHEREAAAFWKRGYFWATHSRLPPMIGAAKMIAGHLPNVLTELVQAPHQQRHGRRPELESVDHPEARLRLPQRQSLQGRGVFPLRRARPVAQQVDPFESLMRRILERRPGKIRRP